VRDVPATVTVLPRSEIEQSPTQTLDELLRTVPSFATFRRTSSVGSDPTAQGVNLRGIGPSGVSRTLVLVDGLPANDPFGGWFYWRQIPRVSIDRIEVVPGGGSALYGNYALGGVVQVFSRPPAKPELDLDAAAGYPRELSLAARGAEILGPVRGTVQGEVFSTAGYPLVLARERGAIDQPAPSDHETISGRAEMEVTPGLNLSVNGGYFHEYQNAGTAMSNASVRSGNYGVGANLHRESFGTFDLRFFGHVLGFNQARTRTTPDRSSEALSAQQDVPADDQGLTLHWTSSLLQWLGAHRAAAGIELRRIHGVSKEDLFPATVTPTSIVHRETGGRQEFAGAFIQDSYQPVPALEVLGALRFDVWRNFDASQLTRDNAQNSSQTAFADRTERQFSPKVGARLNVAEWLNVRGSAYAAFRAPTLNELYRPFQVGTIVTAANDRLTAEKLRGGELGIELNPRAGLNARATGFWNTLDQPITNVTLDLPLPDGSQRQRENLGRARIRGVELDSGWHFAHEWTVTASYTFVDNRVLDAPGAPQLVGKHLAQDPSHRVSLALTFYQPRIVIASLQARFVGPQYEDDLNQLGMPGFLIVDLAVSRRLVENLEAYLAIENLLNREYLVGRSGIDTIGRPFTARLGLRWHLGP
jgi:outer membrane receptor protein involved in Fe transport